SATSSSSAASFECSSPSVADIVILVDGSWSIGRLNFRLVRQFLEALVQAFNVASDKTRIGLVQYSGDPRTEWDLNTYSTKEEVLEAARNLPYKGGNTLTGLALLHVLEQSFGMERGARSLLPKIGILVTDGKSQDEVQDPARQMRDRGIELFAIGIKNADESELQLIASPPHADHMYIVADFNVLDSIIEGLTRTLCNRVEALPSPPSSGSQSAVLGPPSALVTSDPTHGSFRVAWKHPGGGAAPLRYRLEYVNKNGGDPEQVLALDGLLEEIAVSEQQMELVASSVHSQARNLMYWDRTQLRGVPRNVQVRDETTTSMEVVWDPADGPVRLYRITYTPPDGTSHSETVTVPGRRSSVKLQKLRAGTKYHLQVTAVYPEGDGDESSTTGTTLPQAPPRNLRVSDESFTRFRVTWERASSPTIGYRVVHQRKGGVPGGAPKETFVGDDVNSMMLTELDPGTEYNVTVFATYPGGASEPVRSTGRTPEQLPLYRYANVIKCETNGYRVTYQPKDYEAQVEEFYWAQVAGGQPVQVTVADGVNTAMLNNLQPGTEYDVSVSAIYPSGDSQPLQGAGGNRQASCDLAVCVCACVSCPHVSVSQESPQNMRVSEEWFTRFRVTWDRAPSPTNGYRIVYRPRGGQPMQVTVADGANTAMLNNLQPGTEYDVSVSAIYPSGDSQPLQGTGQTLSQEAPQNLRVTDESFTRFRVTWDRTLGPTNGYRVVYRPIAAGGTPMEVIVGDTDTTMLTNLRPGTSYDVNVYALYPGNGASEPIQGIGTTLIPKTVNLRSNNITPKSFCVQWDRVRDAYSYRVVFEPVDGGDRHEFPVPGSVTNQCAYNLVPGMEYRVTITVGLPDYQGPPTTINQRT
uniref:Collagen, type XII, alpha 1b n=1 Tax=Petromyzon marinus TaxID=7757 RepID=S4R4W4_PETMA